MDFSPEALTQARYERSQERTAKSFGFGSTQGATNVIKSYLKETYDNFSSSMEITTSISSLETKSVLKLLSGLSAETLALCSLHCGLSSVGKCSTLRNTIMDLGRALGDEAYGLKFRSGDQKHAQRIETLVKKRAGSLKQRRTALRSMAQTDGIKVQDWGVVEKKTVGRWALEVLLKGSVFVLVEDEGTPTYLTITQDALEHSERLVEALLAAYPVFAPLKTRQPLWTAPTGVATTGGRTYPTRLVRSSSPSTRKLTDATLKASIASGSLDGVLSAINGLQDVAYVINIPILEMVEWSYAAGLHDSGVPRKPEDDLQPPPKVGNWDDMDDTAKRLWRRNASSIKSLNRTFAGRRTTFGTDVATARWLGNDPFWTLTNTDYRGRVYPMCFFNFQRQDYVRALFKFADGKPLGASGLYWLKVHVANCGDFAKISKASFDDRVAWVDENLDDLIMGVGVNPKEDLRWLKADKPFLFLAACMELAKACRSSDPEAYVCNLPISFDGSCSGIQHLSMMTKAPEGILVNLGRTEKTNDVYQVVADKLIVKLQADKMSSDDPEKRVWADMALSFGVDRKFVKRQVMTFSYSSKTGGMRDQLKEDLMKPLEYEVLSGDRESHPFGDEWHKVAQYLAHMIYTTITEVIYYPAEAMRFLQSIASAMSHEGKHLVWTTPLGFPVILRYTNVSSSVHKLFLHDKGFSIRYDMTLQEEAPGIDKNRMRNAIAPCHVHSYDACHLMMVVNAAKTAGIHQIATVHDSFGCLPADADEFRSIILETFVDLYTHNDPLAMIRTEALAQIHTNGHRIPPVPAYGNLNLEEVRHAQYAFA